MTDWIAITDKQLAAKCAEHGVGHPFNETGTEYELHRNGAHMHVSDFVTDWRVAGALLTEAAEIIPLGRLFHNTLFNEFESLARQISISCLIAIECFKAEAAAAQRQNDGN